MNGMSYAISPWDMLRTFPYPLALEYQRYTSVADRDVVRKLAGLSAMTEVAVRYATFVLTADHLSRGVQPAIPRWLEGLKPERKLTFGKWIEALREVAGLAGSRPTFLPEARVLSESGTLELLDQLVKVRNEWAHPAGAFELVDDELDVLLRRGKPLLAQWLARLGFLARYPLCIAQRDELFDTSDEGETAYYVRRYMGVQRDHLDVKLETAETLLEGRPFLLNPSADEILYLWPLVVASDPEGEDPGELFVFETPSSANLDAVEYVSVGQRRKIRIDQPELHSDPSWVRSTHPGTRAASRMSSPALSVVHSTLVDRRVGLTLGKRRPYTLLQRIASGGMGTVYLAADPNGRHYAVKVLHASEGTMLRRFEREISSLGRLAAVAGIVGILDWGSAVGPDGEELRFYVMEYADRGDLGSYIRHSCVAMDETQDPFAWDLEPRLDILERLTAALAGLHEANLVHRDVKPQNVLLMSDGTIRLADLGLIRDLNGRDSITNLYSAVGTNQYMAPEQLHVSDEVPVTAAADVFSFGFLLFELLFCRLPRRGRDGGIADQKALQTLPSALRNLVVRCTNPDPARRYSDGGDLKRAIEGSFPTLRRAWLTVQTEPAGGVVYVGGERRRAGEKLDLPSGAHVLAGALGDLVYTTRIVRLPPLAVKEVVLTPASSPAPETGTPASVLLRYLARIDARVFTRSVGYGTVRDLEDKNSYLVWQDLKRDFGTSPIPGLLGVLRLSDPDLRMKALRLLLHYAVDDPEALDHGAVQQALRSEEMPLMVMLWVDYLRRTPQEHWPLLIDLLASEAGKHLAGVPQTLRRLGRAEVVEALVRVMPAIRDAGTRAEAVRALGGQHPQATAALTAAALHDVSPAVREAAIWALAKEPPAAAFGVILACLRSDASYPVRVAAARALLGIDRERAGAEFAKLEADSGIQTAVAEARRYEG